MALIPKFFLDCVVAIGILQRNKTRWVASGFLFGELVKEEGSEQKRYRVYAVTNRHVFNKLRRAFLRFNPKGREPAKPFLIDLIDKSTNKKLWTPHPNPDIDVAVITINPNVLEQHEIQFAWFASDQHVAPLDKIAELGITEGDFVYTLGFPMGLIGPERNYVIVRSGNIARLQDAIDRRSSEFLIDTFIFPGNSGGPVVTKPEAMAIKKTKAVGSAYLIGVIQAYLPYQDFAVSEQTKRRRVMFEENSGLTSVIPIDFVMEAIEAHKETVLEGTPS